MEWWKNGIMKDMILKIYLQPKSSKNGRVGPYRDGIKVKVTAPPVDGKANKALIQFLAEELGISPSSIGIIQGLHSQWKILRIPGIKNWETCLSSSKHLDFKGKID